MSSPVASATLPQDLHCETPIVQNLNEEAFDVWVRRPHRIESTEGKPDGKAPRM